MKIGKLEFKNGIFLAPMAGVTDVGFRSVCEQAGAELTYTEMVSAKGLYYNSEKTKELLSFEPNHKYKAVQIFGNDPDICASVCADLSKSFDIIDINMGCPAPKIFKNGEGCSLMGNISVAKQVIEKCVQASTIPITVKFRSGIDDNHQNAVEFAKMCEQAGASAITIHARTRNQFYGGKANYDIIKQVVEAVNIPVIGNGDVTDKASLDEMWQTGCSAVMIGRASIGNPNIFATLTDTTPVKSNYEYALEHIEILKKYFSEDYINKYFRKHFLWYMSEMPNCSQVKLEIVKADSLENALSLFKKAMGIDSASLGKI